MIRNKNIIKFYNIVMLLAIISLTSCVSSKEIIYFQDEKIEKNDQVSLNSDLIYKPNDLLTINVSGLDPDAVKPFNLPVVAYSNSVISAEGNLKMQTYLIDINGNIEFPVLGTIRLEGLTRTKATAFLKEKLTEYIKDPIVNIRLANFTITVIGEVNNPGTFTIQDERISLIEALGLAGDLTIHGKRENVFLIREDNGVKRFTKFDLTSIKVVNSRNYYLTQNDVLYVEPNKAKIRSSSYNENNVILISAISTLTTILAVFLIK